MFDNDACTRGATAGSTIPGDCRTVGHGIIRHDSASFNCVSLLGQIRGLHPSPDLFINGVWFILRTSVFIVQQ